MSKNNSNNLESFIANLDEIPEGERNDTLYKKVGLPMRGRLGLERDDLLHALRTVNTAKCRPPMDDDEVERIIRIPSRRVRRKR